jgi:hypothetical protein
MKNPNPGSHTASLFAFVQVVSSFWLLRLSARRQRFVTCILNFRMVGSCPDRVIVQVSLNHSPEPFSLFGD